MGEVNLGGTWGVIEDEYTALAAAVLSGDPDEMVRHVAQLGHALVDFKRELERIATRSE